MRETSIGSVFGHVWFEFQPDGPTNSEYYALVVDPSAGVSVVGVIVGWPCGPEEIRRTDTLLVRSVSFSFEYSDVEKMLMRSNIEEDHKTHHSIWGSTCVDFAVNSSEAAPSKQYPFLGRASRSPWVLGVGFP